MDTPTNTAAILETYEHLLSHTLTLLWERAYYKNGVPHVNIITAELENMSGLTLQETKMEVCTLNILENTDWDTTNTLRSLEAAVVRP